MAAVSMSKQEFSRLEVLLRVQSGRLRVNDACALIGLRRRQVFRVLRGLKQDGAASLVSKRRGKPSNHRLPAEVRGLALAIVRERYADFGPTLAAEKLAAHHGCTVSRETLRGWMIADGLWQDRRHRLPSPHQPRRRRECLGELVQIDGSEHAWFEDRGPPCTLLAFIDDATSRLMQLRFVTSESAFDYFRTTRAYLEEHGKPVAFYSDKHGIFRVNRKEAAGGEGVTQFGRALLALNIDIICANSPQAKGRIERAFGTLQDRMVKELRLAGVSSVAAANAWLPGFITAYNRRFGRDPANAKDLRYHHHRVSTQRMARKAGAAHPGHCSAPVCRQEQGCRGDPNRRCRKISVPAPTRFGTALRIARCALYDNRCTRHRHRRALRSAPGRELSLVAGDIAPLSSRRVEKHRNQTAGFRIDKTLRRGLPVATRRVVRQSLVAPALDQHATGQNCAPNCQGDHHSEPAASERTYRGGSQHDAADDEQRGAQQFAPQRASGSITAAVP